MYVLVNVVDLCAYNAIGMAQRTVLYGVRLTRREREVLNYVVSGMRTKQIAMELCISEYTVYNHRKSVLKKKGARTCRELMPLPAIG